MTPAAQRRTRVKICGITRPQDAEAAVAAGADALGFVFWPNSPRAVTARTAAGIGAGVPPLVTRVGVFVNMAPADVAAIVREARLDAIQLHGEERPAEYGDYEACGAPLIRAFSLEHDADVARALGCAAGVTPLIDALDRERRGGTGRAANWPLAHRVSHARPIILAGGLAPDTVADAIRAVRPWAVDVSSGVEVLPGIKDPARIHAFLAAVAAADREAE
jgi:phosphoribosylanthranilate isomerase